MNKLPLKTRTTILNMLVEGTSMRATSRMTGVSINGDEVVGGRGQRLRRLSR